MRGRFSSRGGMALMLVLGVVIASVSTAGAASLITGKQIKDGTIATKDLSKAVRKQLATTGSAGVTGPQGAGGRRVPRVTTVRRVPAAPTARTAQTGPSTASRPAAT